MRNKAVLIKLLSLLCLVALSIPFLAACDPQETPNTDTAPTTQDETPTTEANPKDETPTTEPEQNPAPEVAPKMHGLNTKISWLIIKPS